MTESARFEELRFTGGRFDTSGLPFEVLPEHNHYRDLLLEVAKAMYFADNPARRRLPNRFEEDLHLRLSDIQGGSVRSIVQREAPDSDPTRAPSVDDYFGRARDHIIRTIQSSSNGADPDEIFALRDYDYHGFLQLGLLSHMMRPSSIRTSRRQGNVTPRLTYRRVRASRPSSPVLPTRTREQLV